MSGRGSVYCSTEPSMGSLNSSDTDEACPITIWQPRTSSSTYSFAVLFPPSLPPSVNSDSRILFVESPERYTKKYFRNLTRYKYFIQKNVFFSVERYSVLEIRRSHITSHTIRAELFLACDGINSVAVKAPHSNLSGVVTSSKGLHYDVFWYSGLGCRLHLMIVRNALLSPIEQVPESWHSYWIDVKERSIDLQVFPMLSSNKEHLGGLLVFMALLPGQTLLEAQSGDIVYSALQ